MTIPVKNEGPLLGLWTLLEGSPYLRQARDGSRIKVLFGEEMIDSEDPPPRVVMIPTTGQYSGAGGRASGPGVDGQGLNNPRVLYEKAQRIELHCWGVSKDKARQLPIHHANETELLVQQAVQALQDQMFPGYFYRVVSDSWVQSNRGTSRLGRACVLLIEAMLPVTMASDEEAEVLNVTIAQLGIPNP